MSEATKKLLNLFRSKSTADEEDQPLSGRRRRTRNRHSASSRRSSRKYSERSHSVSPSAQHRQSISSHTSARSSPGLPVSPLTQWPPSGLSADGSLSQGRAMELIASGAPVFKGFKREVPHAGEAYYNFFALCEGAGHSGSDRAEFYYAALEAASFNLGGAGHAAHPWDTLETPSMSFYYGTRPGTATLNRWVTSFSRLSPVLELRDPGVKPRDVDFSTIVKRLIYLQGGFEEDHEDLMYKNLYRNLLRDPDRFTSPHKAMEKQIADLILILSRPEWIDFSRPEHQVAAKYFSKSSYTDQGRSKSFFWQLLLSIELEVRIYSRRNVDIPKEQLLAQLPPRIAWDLALARKWRQCITIEEQVASSSGFENQQLKFQLRQKHVQVKSLRKFARVMKWPNLVAVDAVLKTREPDIKPLEDRSSDTMSYFTGVILPGPTLPWLLMNSLIDCDDDIGANSLAALTHMHPQCGFQYKSTTYWSSTSIVGKVLAPTCQEIGGWIGPARPAPDLDRVQIARLRQRLSRQLLTISDVESMMIRSDPLGPPARAYPVMEYQLLLPDSDDVIDTVRIEKLALKPVTIATSLSTNPLFNDRSTLYDAAIQFAIDGQSWPLRLSYDVSFISAYPCARGPHPLFFDYIYQAVRVDEIVTIRDWGGLYERASASVSSQNGSSPLPGSSTREENATEKVLVVECFGVTDNEVLARAWCSHWGLSALIANLERTCMSCAIREAYAACVTVVILIDLSQHTEIESG